MNLGSNKTLPTVSIPRDRIGNAVTGDKLSDAVNAARREIGRICLPDGQMYSSWSVGLDCKAWKRIDRDECNKRKLRLL